MKHLLPALLLVAASLRAEDAPVFRDLFNGKDLSGWVDVNTSPETWSVKDGFLVCQGSPIGVMRSEKQFENFILHIEWRHIAAVELADDGDGVMAEGAVDGAVALHVARDEIGPAVVHDSPKGRRAGTARIMLGHKRIS